MLVSLKSCVVWANFTESSGKLYSFTVNGKTIKGRLAAGDGSSVWASDWAKLTFLTAYQSVQFGGMFITARVQSGNKPLSLAIYSAIYRDPSGRQIQASDAGGPTDIGANSNATVYMSFLKGSPGGVVTLDIDDENYNTRTVRLKAG